MVIYALASSLMGQVGVRDMAIDDVTDSSEARLLLCSRSCTPTRSMVGAGGLFDSTISCGSDLYYNNAGECRLRTCGGCLLVGDGFPELASDDLVGFGNPWKRKPYIDAMRPRNFHGVKYGSPSGLMQIMR